MPKRRTSRVLVAALASTCLAATGLLSTASPAAADPVTVSGTVSTPAGTIAPGGYVQFHTASYDQIAFAPLGAGGAYSTEVEPGTYLVDIYGETTTAGGTGSTRFLDAQGPVTITGAGTQNFAVAAQQVQVNLTDAHGDPVAGEVLLRCTTADYYDNAPMLESQTSTSPAQPRTVWGFGYPVEDGAESPCLVGATRSPGDGSTYFTRVDVGASTTQITVAIPDSVRLSGHVDTLAVDPGLGMSAHLSVEDNDGNRVADAVSDEHGDYDVQVPPGSYDLKVRADNGRGTISTWHGVEVAGDTTFDRVNETVPVTVHLLRERGSSAQWTVQISCSGSGGGPNYRYPEGRTDSFDSQAEGNPIENPDGDGGENVALTLNGVTRGARDWDCYLRATSEEQDLYGSATIPATDAHLTWDLATNEILTGTPGVSVDDDGVLDTVESQGPNNGDGNYDDVPDHQQNNVTSLPGFGATPGQDAPYVTVAGPAGMSLADVTSTDPAGAETPPPDGVTLPAGLVGFTLNGVPPGSTQTVELWTNASLENVVGYAKYDPASHTWSMLPADRVDLLGDHVAIRLTDGGVGDADGLENGIIVDPGGLAASPPSDTTPPEVTGRPTTRPNAAGWYRTNVRIRWTATDEESGVESQPASTVVSTQGDDVTATSPEVCDTAPTPNCGTGEVTGLKIDKTAPALSVTGVSNGATYTLGNVPTPRCVASDALSGLNGACAGTRVGGNRNGVGTFTYAARVADRAGNTRTVSATYRVGYRFDGFLAPLNDPAAPVSVFKAGSTVPVGITVKRSNGAVVTPVSKPVWVTPVRGARTSSPVNEAVSTAKGTTGSSFVWRNGRWQFDWSTKGVAAGYQYRIGVRLDDGTTHVLTIGLR